MFEVSPLPHLIALVLLAWLWLGLAWRGWYLAHNPDLLLILFGVAMPIVLLGAMLAFPSGRQLLLRFADETRPEALAGIHTLRILAIGTLYSWWRGEIPGHFEIPVGIPDFLIGLTAPLVARRVGRDPDGSRRLFAVWNILGAAVLLQAPLWMQLSQPGPLQVFHRGPRTDAVFSFPLAIVPTVIAPIFISVHAAALARLWRRKESARPADSDR
jgi:hypothetical protein